MFEHIVVPQTATLLARGEWQGAVTLNRLSLSTIAIVPHTQERWAWHFSKTNPLFAEAGERLRVTLPELAWPASDTLRLAVVADRSILGGSGLAMLIGILEQLAPARHAGIGLMVYTIEAAPEELVSRCQALGIPVIDFGGPGVEHDPSGDELRARLIAMRERAQRDCISVALFSGTYEGIVSLAASLGIAPAQAYLTMGFHSLDCPRIDAYFACASLTGGVRQILGRPWQTIPFPFADPFPDERSSQAAALHAQASAARAELLRTHTTILGTLARPAKLDDQFVAALATILGENPGAAFLWFGHPQSVGHLEAIALFEKYGIGDRCLYQGWVDTKVYSRVLDVHLDCFGLPTGLTMAETFSAGTAYVLRRGAESSQIGLTAVLASIVDGPADDPELAEARRLFVDAGSGEDLLMLANDTDRYVAFANRLIRDAAFRGRVGHAARQFMRKYFHDSNHMGQVFAKEITAVVAEARSRYGFDILPTLA